MVTVDSPRIINTGIEKWLFEVLACPECKSGLTPLGEYLHCGICNKDYLIENGIPSLIPITLSTALIEGQEPVKRFYIEEEHYDWTKDPKGLEYLYHHFRKWETWKEVSKALKPGITALDIGCGTGLITQEFRRRLQRVVAMDLNRWALSRMDGKPFVAKVHGDGESIPIMDESVDLVVATEVIEHLEQPEKTANEIFRVCRKGARVISSVPSTNRIWHWRQYLSMTCGGGEPFHHNYTKKEIMKLWKDAGFKTRVKWSCLGLNWLCLLEKP